MRAAVASRPLEANTRNLHGGHTLCLVARTCTMQGANHIVKADQGKGLFAFFA